MRRNSVKIALFTALLSINCFAFSATKTFYDLERASHFDASEKGPYFIQMGNFSKRINALEFERRLRASIRFPVAIHHTNQHFLVIVGPMKNAQDVREAGRQLQQTQAESQRAPIRHYRNQTKTAQLKTQHSFLSQYDDVKMGKAYSPWFVGIGPGVQQLNVVNPIYVSNGSNFSRPYNNDQFSTATNTQAVIATEIGYRWRNAKQWIPGRQWFPAYAVSFYYNHLFSTDIGDQIEQYSIPAFTNYHYNWKASADVLLAVAKLNLIEYEQFSPFVQVGLGGSLNHACQYNETAYPNVTPRVSPAFSNYTTSGFAYDLGAGIDWQFHPHFSLSLLYQFQNLGSLQSGKGASTWSGDTLHSDTYQTNLALLKLDYHFSL